MVCMYMLHYWCNIRPSVLHTCMSNKTILALFPRLFTINPHSHSVHTTLHLSDNYCGVQNKAKMSLVICKWKRPLFTHVWHIQCIYLPSFIILALFCTNSIQHGLICCLLQNILMAPFNVKDEVINEFMKSCININKAVVNTIHHAI